MDVEHALDPRYAKIVGVDLDNLMVSQPESGEDALNITETLIRSGAIDVIVVDSVAALVSRQELDGQMGDTTVGLQARMMSQAMRRLTAAISKTNCVCIFTNQIRKKSESCSAVPRPRLVEELSNSLLDPHGHSKNRSNQGIQWNGNRITHSAQSREEQSRAALHCLRIRHHVRRRNFAHRFGGRPWNRA